MKALKRFCKTTLGKTLLYLCTNLTFTIFLISTILIFLMINAGGYRYSLANTYTNMIREHIIQSGYHMLFYQLDDNAFLSTINESQNMIYELWETDTTGNNSRILANNNNNNSGTNWNYAVTYHVTFEYDYYSDSYFPYIDHHSFSIFDSEIGDFLTEDYIQDRYLVEITDSTLDIAETPNSVHENYSKDYVFYIKINHAFPKTDYYSILFDITRISYQLRYPLFGIVPLSFLLWLLCFVMLMSVSARRPDSEELHPGPLHKVPFDIVLLIYSAVLVVFILIIASIWYDNNEIPIIIITSILLLISIHLQTGLCMGIAARIKDKSFLPNTVTFRLLRWIGKGFRYLWKGIRHLWNAVHYIPMIWRTILITLGIVIVNGLLLLLAYDLPEGAILLYIIQCILVVPPIFYLAFQLRKLQQAGIALAAGDLNYHTDTRGMFWDFKRHGENLNDIAKGMVTAVEKQLKSERLKTELITNVSHDIKTPLTSIISYSTLISEEPCDNEHIHEYADALIRQSDRLKRLIEDLVEASKASTGNLDVILSPCDLSILLTQAAGEYENRMEEHELTLITKQPEQAVHIMADGRRLWRVIDNLMNNICKYAQSGTRVYISLEHKERFAVITFKNTSHDPLDLTADELMERFVRGDSSRNTEGNGLGLSIARSLTELQHGTFELIVDGDLFKVILTFPTTE